MKNTLKFLTQTLALVLGVALAGPLGVADPDLQIAAAQRAGVDSDRHPQFQRHLERLHGAAHLHQQPKAVDPIAGYQLDEGRVLH